MLIENQTSCFNVQYFVVNEKYELSPYPQADKIIKDLWVGYYTKLTSVCEAVFRQYSLDTEVERPIRILFLTKKQLSGKILLNNLTQRELEAFKQNPGNSFSPLITIGLFDIMSLYSYSFDREVDDSYEMKTLRDLRLDHRYKFLDSSIWFRYIPIKPLNSKESEYSTILDHQQSFFERFKHLLTEICNYWSKGLYFTNAAVATLELQLRLLQESRITNQIGDGGHAEAVTPFKFHSESFLEKRAQTEIKFLKEPWTMGVSDEKTSIASQCKFRVLIVDDQACGEHRLSAVNEKYEKIPVNKQELILLPIQEIFDAEHIIPEIPPQETGVIDFCLGQLKDKHFDLIFLDYLLGDRSDSDGTREYGHEFLLNLLNDSKQKDFQYKRSFQGRFWIFSISSFPFALPDKLHQLGISHLQNLWHLSYGGDPVTTPHLYTYYLLRFIKQKVSVYFLHPELLLRILKENPVAVRKGNEKFWATYLENNILAWRHRIELARQRTQDNKSSPFTESIASFCADNIPLDKVQECILKVTTLIKKGQIGGKEFFACQTEFNLPVLQQYQAVGDYLFAQISKFQKLYDEDQKNRVEEASRLEVRNLNLEDQKMYQLPSGLDLLSGSLQELVLSNNHLTSFPRELFHFKNLTHLHLDNNRLLQKIMGNIQDLPKLANLNIEKTPLAKKLIKSRAHAKTRKEVENLWNELIALSQKDAEPKKVLFFGISPDDETRARVEREFNIIQTALKGQSFKLKPYFAVNYTQFQSEVIQQQAKIIHFAGHGRKDALVFEQNTGLKQLVYFDEVISHLFSKQFILENLECIILNACHTNEQAERLSANGIFVVGMSGAIEDGLAQHFSDGFYGAASLLIKNDYKEAFEMGVKALKSEKGSSRNGNKRDTVLFNTNKSLTINLWQNGVVVDFADF